METSGKRRLRMGKKGQSTRSGKTLVENRSVRTRSCLDSEAIKTLQIAYEFHGYWEETLVCQGEKYCKIEIEGGGHLQTVGAPNLPQEGIYVNIPENAKFLNLQVGECHEKTIEVEYPIAPKNYYTAKTVQFMIPGLWFRQKWLYSQPFVVSGE